MLQSEWRSLPNTNSPNLGHWILPIFYTDGDVAKRLWGDNQVTQMPNSYHTVKGLVSDAKTYNGRTFLLVNLNRDGYNKASNETGNRFVLYTPDDYLIVEPINISSPNRQFIIKDKIDEISQIIPDKPFVPPVQHNPQPVDQIKYYIDILKSDKNFKVFVFGFIVLLVSLIVFRK